MRRNTTPGVSIQPCQHPPAFFLPMSPKQMISASAEGGQQRTCPPASALGWICSTGAPEETFVQHKMRCDLTLKDFSRSIARERDTRGENPLCVYCCWSYCTSEPNLSRPKTPAPSCHHSLPSTGRGTSSCLHQVQGKSRQEPTQELNMSQDTRELKVGLKVPAKAEQSSPYQPSLAQPR